MPGVLLPHNTLNEREFTFRLISFCSFISPLLSKVSFRSHHTLTGATTMNHTKSLYYGGVTSWPRTTVSSAASWTELTLPADHFVPPGRGLHHARLPWLGFVRLLQRIGSPRPICPLATLLLWQRSEVSVPISTSGGRDTFGGNNFLPACLHGILSSGSKPAHIY